MHALRPSSLFRPSSRPTSPIPVPTANGAPRSESVGPVDRAPRSLAKLSLTSFRRPSPAPAQVSAGPAAAITQDGSYLEVLSLKLSEVVSRALAQPTGPAAPHEQLNGRRPIPPGRGHALGALIETELNASRGNPHLRKAVLRTLQRPLSTLLTTLSSQLLPLLSSPAFTTPSAPTSQNPSLTPVQTHALGLAMFAGELLETFDDLGLGLDADVRGDGLKSVRESLASVARRVINPIVAGIKSELLPLIEAVEQPSSGTNANGNPTLPKSTSSKPGVSQHHALASLQVVMPIYARTLSRCFAVPTTHSTLATFIISLAWRALVALSHRVPVPPSPPTSPPLTPGLPKKTRSNTPPTTPPSTKFILKLPASRPPSPPAPRAFPSVAADARTLFDLLNMLPRPSTELPTTRLAREAVDDAFNGLQALVALLELEAIAVSGRDPAEVAKELVALTVELPTLIALPVLLNAFVLPYHSSGWRTVAGMLGMSESEYRQGCLAGFGRAEECTTAVGQRALDVLAAEPGLTAEPAAQAVVLWLTNEVAEAEA
ncbi:hypothetical protein OF83DRAFT_26697 [Amylostereum chailletii]|nr:hypothetical protein OF83DRAFT_26697 [Amylostereum chailletii]